jgi:hypothetical protein
MFFGSFSKFVSLEMFKKKVSMETLQKFRKMSQDLLLLEDDELKSTGGSNVEAMIEEKARTRGSPSTSTVLPLGVHAQGFISVQTFVRFLLELLNTADKVGLPGKRKHFICYFIFQFIFQNAILKNNHDNNY